MRLQLALDLLDLGQATMVARAAAPWVDVVEAGTPLIKAVGMAAVRQLRKACPDKTILADLKIVDLGGVEVAMAAEAGAGAVTVLACAPRETIAAAVGEARARGVELVADLIGVEDLPARLALLSELAVTLVAVHTGIDEQRVGRDPFQRLREVAALSQLRLAEAGGLGPANLHLLPRVPSLERVIVGGAIANAADPAEQARAVSALVRGD